MTTNGKFGRECISRWQACLKPEGNKGKLEYALAGFGFYASKYLSMADWARMAVQRLLETGHGECCIEYPESKHFLLTQFKWKPKRMAVHY